MMGRETQWQGLDTTLTMPRRKEPAAARAVPAITHEFTVKDSWSNILPAFDHCFFTSNCSNLATMLALSKKPS